MDFTFFDQTRQNNSLIYKFENIVNSGIKWLGLNYEFNRLPNNVSEMVTMEQRINLFHQQTQVLVNNVKGDIVELGCHLGQCSLQMEKMLEEYHSEKHLHLYDCFNLKYDSIPDIKSKLIQNFRKS